MTEVIDAEIVDEPGTALIPRGTTQVGLFGTDQPELIIQKATRIADVLKGVIVKQGLATRIGSSEYIRVEGWTTLGNLVGVFPKVEWTRAIGGDDPGWEAAVVVVNAQGVEIGRAEAQCLRSERNWKGRDDFALRSMAQTRAMGKALRMPLGWIATLAGFEATPAEEMPAEVEADDVPFDETGPAQDPPQAHTLLGDQAETGGASTTTDLAAQAVILAELLADVADKLGAKEATEHAIAKNLQANKTEPAKHVAWLKRQLVTAEKNLAAVTA